MSHAASPRPPCIGPSWLRCTDGYSFAAPPDPRLREDRALASPNLWERLLCVTLRAQAGEFGDVAALLPVIEQGPTVHLRDCAVRVFAQAAPSSLVPRLAEVLEHRDADARIEALAVVVLAADLSLVDALVRHRARSKGFERETTMDALSAMLEPYVDDLELPDSVLDDAAFAGRVAAMVAATRDAHGPVAVYHGAPVDPAQVAASIAELCAEDDPELRGGAIHERFALLEGMTGWPFAGCLDDECMPVLPKISYTLNALQQSGRLARVEVGRRCFFGHPLP